MNSSPNMRRLQLSERWFEYETFGSYKDGETTACVQRLSQYQERRLLYWNSIGYLLCDRLLNRSQMGALLGISEDTMIEKVVYNDFDCAYKSDLEGFNLDDNVKNEVEVKKMAVGIYYMGETLIPLATEDKKMAGLICWSQLAPVEDEIKNNGFIRFYQRKLGNGRTYFVVKNGMRVRAAVTSYSLNEYAEATLQELVAMLAETHTGEQEEHEQTFDNLTDEAEDEADDEKA